MDSISEYDIIFVWISIGNESGIGFVIYVCGVYGLNQRGLHSRNKKAMEYVAKGWSAIKEVDRVIDYCELNDRRLIPLLRVLLTFLCMQSCVLVLITILCYRIVK